MCKIYNKFTDKIWLNRQMNRLNKCHPMMIRVAATPLSFIVTMSLQPFGKSNNLPIQLWMLLKESRLPS